MNADTARTITARNNTARDLIARFADVLPAMTGVWRYLDTALADIPALLEANRRLADELTETRLDRANLIAAMRATLAAWADGEPNPLVYLRMELDAPQATPRTRRRRP